MKLDPEWPRPLNDMAILFRLEGRMVLALNQILAALEMDPEGAVTHYNYGVILEVMGRYSEARAQYERVIELDATIPASHYNIACHYARDGDLEAALPYLTEAIRLEEKFRKECEKDPDFDRVRDEAEFVALLEGTGITGSPRTTSP
jgi:tetratricopeptide (TPR) repeat protein